jgi:hypothetical protein
VVLDEYVFLEFGVPVVLNGVGGAARKELRDLHPAIAQSLLGVEDGPVLLRQPRIPLDRRVEIVVPP